MRTAFKILISYCLTVAVLFSVVSCDHSSGVTDSVGEANKTNATPLTTETQAITLETTVSETVAETTTAETVQQGTTVLTLDELPEEQTTPEETVPTDGTSETVVPEQTTPEQTTVPKETTTPEEVTTLEGTTVTQEITETTPEETTTPEPPHEHKIVNGQCACGFVPVADIESLYDNDGDGDMDVFCFSAVLPERFTSNAAIHFGAEEYDYDSSAWVTPLYEGDDTYYFCRNGRKSYIVYEVEVAAAGVYEMAIYQRMKDTEVYGAKFTVNEGSEGQDSLSTSYQFATEQDLMQICVGAEYKTSYMFGIELELVAGVNVIKIELAPGVENSQYFGAFYLAKISD